LIFKIDFFVQVSRLLVICFASKVGERMSVSTRQLPTTENNKTLRQVQEVFLVSLSLPVEQEMCAVPFKE
jgi:hypothetical protein